MPKTIVVVGASRGIGFEMVKQFAKAGHSIFALSRDLSKMNDAFKEYETVHPIAFDLSHEVSEQVQVLLEKIGVINILINNAGYLVNKPFETISHEDFQLSYQINVIGVMETVQGFLPSFHPDAHILNISSMGGFQGSMKFAGLSAYSTSKAALCSFTELFSEEYKETQLAMNCLCLGAVQTEMLQEAFPGYEAPTTPDQMAAFIVDFALNGNRFFKGKILPVSLSTP
ncbi:MAG: SDR family oxidoreductase [Crocinitomicaceae bacterium]|nr:SDR family oxidoreductase [Crocinitomicaceae bacterium]MCF8443691.1 SDR family oxidoreductase [Crocinitomicaceae bacterium]